MDRQAPHSNLAEDHGEGVEIRAFRGTRRSSVYRECVVSERVFRSLLAAGESIGLPVLSSLDPYGPHELDKADAAKLADEVAVIQERVNEPQFADISQVAMWCARARANSWMRIVGA
jgi:hypothetical protein